MENIKVYTSIKDFLTACDLEPDHTWKDHNRSSRDTGREEFFGDTSYNQAKELALHGWDRGLEEINTKLSFTAREGDLKQTIKDVAGHSPDVARYCAGLPDNMNRKVVTPSKRKPCLDIVVNASYAHNIKPYQIMNYGAGIASAIDSLEHNGYSISLKVGATSTNNSGVNQGYLVEIKHHGDPLDIGKLAYFIAHPSQLRRLGFSHWEVNNKKNDLGGGYGTICDLPKEQQGDLYFGKESYLSDCNTPANALEYVKGIIKGQMPDLLEDAA